VWQLATVKVRDCILDYIIVSAKKGKDLSSSQKNRNEEAKGRAVKLIFEVSMLFYSVNDLNL